MKVLRSTLFAATAVVFAACGDKVTVTQPAAATPQVLSVSVAPSTATMSVTSPASTLTLTAAISADAGATTTPVTWTSSDAAKVSVVGTTSSAVVTALAATPGVAVCAAVGGKTGCATIVVQAAPTVIPASVSIQSVTVNPGGAPVVPTAVAGQIDVRVNVSPGNQTVQRVVLLVGTTRTDSQVFTAAQSAALRSAADEAIANQSAFPPILFSVNTASFNATTGVPTWTNGTGRTVSVQLYVSTAPTVSSASATWASALTFANANTYTLTSSFTGTTGSANSAAGFAYRRGSLSLSVLPVIYTGGITMAAGTITFGNGAATSCDRSGTSARTVALTAPVAPATAWTGTIVYTDGSAAAAGDLDLYEFDQTVATCPAGSINVGEGFTVTATDNNGNGFLGGVGGANAAANLWRVDNRPPTVPAGANNAGTGLIRINVNPFGRANGWINDAVVLNAAATSATGTTANNFLCGSSAAGFGAACIALDTLPRDAGVGGAVYSTQVGTTKTLATTAAAITSAASLAPSATNAGYCAIAYASDALGNKTASPSTTTACAAEVNSALIGVDRYSPTINYCAAPPVAPCVAGSIAANARLSGGTVGGEFIVTVNDTGLVGNSGMLLTAPVKMTISRRAAGTTPNSAGTTILRDGTGAATVTALTATGVVAAAPNYSTSFTGITGAANHAYWTHNATAYDAAGNTASVVPRVMVYDATAAVPGIPSAPLTLTATGYSTSSFINEDLDIWDYSFGVTYTGAPVIVPVVLGQAPITVNGFNAATFSNTNFLVTTSVGLPLSIQANVAAGLTNMASIATTARGQGNLSATSGAFAPATVTPGTAISLTNFTTFAAVALPAGVTGVVTGNTTAPSVGGVPLASSVVLTANVVGAPDVFNNPFTRMDFYMLNAAGTQYLLVGSATASTLNDNGLTRTFTFTATISGATIYTQLGGAGATWASQVVALGMNTSGTIGMVSAALTALNVVF